LPYLSQSLALNKISNTEVYFNRNPHDSPPNHPNCELNCVWII
jgi:hypothetical protein